METGEAVLQIKIETYKGLAIMQLALSQQNIGLWQKALHDHISELGATLPASYCFYEKQDVADDHHFAAIVEVEYDNKRFSIPMHIGDDADDIVTHFLEEHALNSDLHSSITAQVFKVQKELFLDMYVEHRRLNMNLIMKTQDLILSETRADMAEKHADEISQSLANLQHTVPALVSFTKTKEAEVASQAAKIDQQKDELNEEKRTVNILYEENERLRNMLTATGVTLKPQNDDGSLIEREPRTTSVATAASSSELVSENKRLREQTVRMRREILQLNAKVKDIQAAALLAFEHFNVDTIEKTSSAGMSEYKDTAASSSGATAAAAAAAKPIRDSSGPSPAGDSTTLSNIRRNVAIASTSADTGASTQAAGTKRIDLHPHMADFSKSTLSVMSAVNSPIVEDRLVRALFNRYADPGDHTLTMSRFLRCAKESGITSGGTGPSAAHAILASPASDLVSSALGLPRGVAFEPPFLEYGEVSMIFTNAVKNDALLLSSTHTIAVALNTDDYSTNIKKDRDAFNVRSFSNDYRRNSPNRQKPKLAVLMNLPQFVAALEQISVKLFSGLIEQQTGTIAECLPGHQKVAAMRAAFEVLLKRKIIPSVTSFGLMPWGLMSVECALASIESCFPNSSTSITTPLGETLAQHAGRIVSWHLAYSAQAMASAGQLHSIAKMESKLAMGTDLVGITYAEISRFCHEHAVVPYLLKEPQLLRYKHVPFFSFSFAKTEFIIIIVGSFWFLLFCLQIFLFFI